VASEPEHSSSVSDARHVTHRGVTISKPTARSVKIGGRLLVATAIFVALSACTSSDNSSPDVASVTRVVDGDTVALAFTNTEETVRLIGIDTPETVKPNSPVECFGPEASERTKTLLPAGTKVRVERDIEARDRYGRLLAYLRRVDDGLFVNKSLVIDGFATPLRIEPNIAYADDFARAAEQARAAQLGLWAVCDD